MLNTNFLYGPSLIFPSNNRTTDRMTSSKKPTNEELLDLTNWSDDEKESELWQIANYDAEDDDDDLPREPPLPPKTNPPPPPSDKLTKMK